MKGFSVKTAIFRSMAAAWLCTAPLFAADNPDLGRRATITASVASDAAAVVADGVVPAAGGRDDHRTAWTVKPDALPASLTFTWPEPVEVSTVVYYGFTAWGLEVFKDYALYLDDAAQPVVEGTFRDGHGPQTIALPAPARARSVRLEFRSHHRGDRPGAAEVQIFARPPAAEDLLCRFTDLSLDYRYAYYPSHDLVRIHLPKPPAAATDWHLALRPRAGGAVLAERSGKLPTASGGEALPVPELPPGEYTLSLTLTGGPEPVIEERVIRRDRAEWEGTRLGLEDVVVPPFTPLETDAEGPVVRSVLRSHAHGAAGLWRQVVSEGRDLLAAPVRLEVTQGGKVHAAGGGPARIVAATPTRVRGEAGWTAGPLSGTTRFAYDYDGMQTITLELAATETEVDRVQLVIPLKASEAWLMHPVTTGLRQHFAGRIPALPEGGKRAGKVWDSAKVPDRLDGIFVPYIYVGGPERGICFAADNDRDWINDRRRLGGKTIADIPVDKPPTRQDRIPSAATASSGDFYAQRLRGTVRPEADGDYQFFIAGDDQCELRLAVPGVADGKPARIAHVPFLSMPREWKKCPEQASAPVTLKAGQEYAIEILHKEREFGDHVAVAWTGPGIAAPVVLGEAGSRATLTALDGKPGLSRDYWDADNAQPIEIDRDGDTVNLRLNLVAAPARLTRPRSITFALQATPAKPMPDQPYDWRRWWATGTDPAIENVSIDLWPSNEYWGGRHHATSIFPAFKDYRFWEQLAAYRRDPKRDPAFEEQWLARFKNLPPQDLENLKGHFNAGWLWGANSRAITPQTKKFGYVIPYTNPRGADGDTPEFLTTYLDEWLAGDIVDPAWHGRNTFQRPRRAHDAHPGGGNWYEIEPVPSRIDMLLFYHKKMLETFADGIYWDNFFLQANYAPAAAGGPGYVDDDGRPRAGVNLMGFRDLVRRTATMMHVMGRRPLTFIHMTNVNIVPMLSFGTVNLDWEWRMWGEQQKSDVQDRISLDEILAHHLGLQSGNLSVAIYGMTLQGQWLLRTVIAACLPHEIRVFKGYGSPDVTFVQNELARFGYGMPDCRVFRYWDDGFPLEAEGAEMRALVLARDGKAMIALGNFGPAKAAAGAGAGPENGKPYTVRLKLDMAALGVPETARAWDVELKAKRTKAQNPATIKAPAKPDPAFDPAAGGEADVELEEQQTGLLERLAPGVYELEIAHHDFALIVVEP
jgi:hypothetical protein